MLLGRVLATYTGRAVQQSSPRGCPVRARQRRGRQVAHSSTGAAVAAPDGLSHWQQDAAVSNLANLCYVHDDDELKARLQAAGLRPVAVGSTYFTRFFIADGPSKARYICVRGVSWSAPGLQAMALWRLLMNVLPSPFLAHLTQPGSELSVHSGISQMAQTLWDNNLHTHVESAEGPIHFAGHSLGGSLATLLTGMASLQFGNNVSVRCSTFGSLPVFALDNGSPDAIPAALGVPEQSFRNFVMADDPVPRALLGADPAFAALKGLPGVQTMMDLRERFFGQGGMLSGQRFLYHPAGEVFLLDWNQQQGYKISQLPANALADHLALDMEGLRAAPLRALLGHHCTSYAHALQALGTLSSAHAT